MKTRRKRERETLREGGEKKSERDIERGEKEKKRQRERKRHESKIVRKIDTGRGKSDMFFVSSFLTIFERHHLSQ